MSAEPQTIDGVEVRPIPNAPNYSISRDGRVRSHPREVPCKNGTGGEGTRLVKGRWVSTHSKQGITKATLSVDGEPYHLNVGKTVAEVWTMTGTERSLLLFFETCLVDRAGAIDTRRMNDDDFEIAERWNAEGFVRFGRVKAKDLTETRSHWVEFAEPAWQAAHLERRTRATRVAANRTWERNPPRKGEA